jgi:hypothetical protein
MSGIWAVEAETTRAEIKNAAERNERAIGVTSGDVRKTVFLALGRH